MHDKGKVLIGIAVFLVVVLFPIWYSAASGKAGHVPDPVIDTEGPNCVEPADWMRSHHMELLDDWRDEVVRENDRYLSDPVGRNREFTNKSLSGTCLGCHKSKENFCDACHDYVGVEPDCWDCHNLPGGN